MLLYENHFCLFLTFRVHAARIQWVNKLVWSTDYPRPTRRDSLPRLIYLLLAVGRICIKNLMSINVYFCSFLVWEEPVRYQKVYFVFPIYLHPARAASPSPFLPWPWKLCDREDGWQKSCPRIIKKNFRHFIHWLVNSSNSLLILEQVSFFLSKVNL